MPSPPRFLAAVAFATLVLSCGGGGGGGGGIVPPPAPVVLSITGPIDAAAGGAFTVGGTDFPAARSGSSGRGRAKASRCATRWGGKPSGVETYTKKK